MKQYIEIITTDRIEVLLPSKSLIVVNNNEVGCAIYYNKLKYTTEESYDSIKTKIKKSLKTTAEKNNEI